MKAIVAVSKSWGIGWDQALLYRISADLHFFKRMTVGKTVLMGRNTYKSIGKPLPERTNVVLTSNKTFQPEQVIVVHSFEELLRRFGHKPDVFCIGGDQLYHACLHYCDQVYVTKIHGDRPANKFFPNLDELKSEWEIKTAGAIQQDKGIQFQHLCYIRHANDVN